MIYMDHAATTPVDPIVFEVMQPYYMNLYGNPSSIYSFGQKSRQAVEESRDKIAHLLNASRDEVYFTSGGTEASNHTKMAFITMVMGFR